MMDSCPKCEKRTPMDRPSERTKWFCDCYGGHYTFEYKNRWIWHYLRVRDWMEDVRRFHEATDTPSFNKPRVPDRKRIQLRVELLLEEFGELMEAMGVKFIKHWVADDGPEEWNYSEGSDSLTFSEFIDDDWLVDEKKVDLVDLTYVNNGTALEFGIPKDEVWNEIQRSNMTKVDEKTGKVRKRADGKVLKPDSFSPADVKSIIERGQK